MRLAADRYDDARVPPVQDIYDAKTAVEHLKGFNVANRYLILLYYNPAKINKKVLTSVAWRAVRSFLVLSEIVAKLSRPLTFIPGQELLGHLHVTLFAQP